MLGTRKMCIAVCTAVMAMTSSFAFAQPESISKVDLSKFEEQAFYDAPSQVYVGRTVGDILAGRNEALPVSETAYQKHRTYFQENVVIPYGAPRNPTGDIYNTDLAIDETNDAPGDGPVSVHAAFNNLTFGPPNPQQNGAFLDLNGLEGILDGQIHDVTETATDLGNGVFRYNFTYQLRLPTPFPTDELFPGGLTVGNGGLTAGFIFFGDVEALNNPNGHRILSYTIDLFDRNDVNVGAFDGLGTLADNNSPWDGEASVFLPGVAGLGTSRIEIEMIAAVGGQAGPFGSCCLPGLDCVDSVTQLQCETAGGVYSGDGSVCATTDCFAVPGACCDTRTGTCTEGVDVPTCVPTVRDAFFARFLSANSVCADFDPPCSASAIVVPCLPNDIAEGETACTINDTYNSGCNSANPGGDFNAPILTNGDTVCGTGWNDLTDAQGNGFRDTDWYKIVTTDPETQVTLTCNAEFRSLVGIINTGGIDQCPAIPGGFLASNVSPAGSTNVVTACLAPGTWYIFVATSATADFTPCEADLTYRLTVAALAPCIVLECPPGSTGTPPNGIGNGAAGTIAVTADRRFDIGFVVADNFSPNANGQVSTATWWGRYNDLPPNIFDPCPDGGLGSPMDDDWQITYYRNNDVLDLPGTLLAGPFNVTVSKSLTGRVVGGNEEVEFSATHPPVDVQATKCYWIELSNNTTGCFSTLGTATGGDDRSAQRDSGNPAYVLGDENDFDLAVCVGIPAALDGCLSSTDFEGACCLTALGGGTNANGCVVLPFGDCVASNGIFAGFDTTCADTNCAGACCSGIDSCSIVTYEACFSVTSNVFAFQGIGTDCSNSPCADGACCFVDGSCLDTASAGSPVFGTNCSPVLVSTEAPNIWDRTALSGLLPLGAVGGFTAGAACDFITFAPCPQPNIGFAPSIPCNGSLTFNNLGLGPAGLSGGDNGGGVGVFDQPDVSCFGGGPAAEMNGAFWVTFTATAAQTQVTTCGSLVNDTVLAVYEDSPVGVGGSGSVSEGTEIACNEDATNPCGGDPSNFNAEVCIDTNIGQQYWVQVGSFSVAEQGVIEVAINCAADVCDVAVCATCTGDVNGDNSRDGRDVQAFTTDILGPANNPCSDFNSSGATDLGDIPGFVAAILGGGC